VHLALGRFRATKDPTGLVEQVKGRFPGPGHDPKSAARLCGGEIIPAFGADRYGPGLAAFQVREAQAGGGHGRDPELARGAEQEAASPSGQSDHRRTVVEPAAQVPPFPVPQVLRGGIELAPGIDHVVRGQRGGRRAATRASVRLEVRLALLGIGLVPLLVGVQPFPGHTGQPAEQGDREEGQQ